MILPPAQSANIFIIKATTQAAARRPGRAEIRQFDFADFKNHQRNGAGDNEAGGGIAELTKPCESRNGFAQSRQATVTAPRKK
jgi:hypothetical protein